jgi:hypothetical protein
MLNFRDVSLTIFDMNHESNYRYSTGRYIDYRLSTLICTELPNTVPPTISLFRNSLLTYSSILTQCAQVGET